MVLSKLGSKGWTDLLPLALGLLIILVAFPDIITSPSDFLFNDEGDGLKNYFTMAYYIANDNGWHFSGMNYPYGELIPFTDNQPILSGVLNFIDNYIVPLPHSGIGLLNILLLLSIPFCALFVHNILKHYGVTGGLAVWASLIVAFLSPQLARLSAHFALAYTMFIPMTWWMIIKIGQSERRALWVVLLGLSVMIQSFIHLYFLLINVLFIASMIVSEWLISLRTTKKASTAYWLSFTATACAGAVVFVTLKMNDPVQDRPTTPWGVETYITNVQSIFLPARGPIHALIKPQGIVAEGEAYLGLMGLPLFLLFVLIIVQHLFFKHSKWQLPFKTEDLLVPSLAGILIFLYASGILNKLGLWVLNEYIAPLKQFRSLGRFSWISYYLLIIPFLTFISRWSESLGRANYSKLSYLPYLLLMFWSWESFQHFRHTTADIRHENKLSIHHNHTDFNRLLSAHDLSAEDHQAILSLPLCILGPERIQIDRGHWPLQTGMEASYKLSLPLMDIMMSRTSISQAMDLVELLTPHQVKKSRLSKMDDRPVLVMSFDHLLSEREKQFVDRCTFLFKDGDVSYYQFKKEDRTDFILDSTFTRHPPILHFSYNDDSGKAFAGNAGLHIDGEKYEIWKGGVDDDVIFEASFWLFISHDMSRLPDIKFRKASRDGKILYEGQFNYKGDIVGQDQWLRIDWPFDRSSPDDVFSVSIENGSCYIDEFQIRPRSATTYVTSGSDVLIDNYKLPSE